MRILMEQLYRQAYQTALAARHPLLVSHPKPDGDTLGAMVAFGHALDVAGKAHTRFCVDVPPKQYHFMPGVDRVISDVAQVRAARPDAVFVFDAGDLRFAGIDQLLRELVPQHIVNIDHHVSNARFGTVNVVVVDASSTAEVVHRILVANGVPITHGIATCLLTGLCTDTSNFSNPATSAPALAVGAALLRHGGKFSAVLKHLVRNKTVSTLRLWGIALSRLAYNEQYGTASTVITLQDLATTQAEEEATEGLSNFLNAVLDVPTVMVLRELQGSFVRGSLRTTGTRDVSLVAKALGGGGHKKAAGFTVRGRLEEQDGRWRLLVAN
ncbi:DHH family phosphoesterase [Patescibacteria group bacterium]|nr:DHH family phosphoesterase [Patescibacteria group bacterium]